MFVLSKDGFGFTVWGEFSKEQEQMVIGYFLNGFRDLDRFFVVCESGAVQLEEYARSRGIKPRRNV